MPVHTNTFTKLQQDIDPHLQSSDSYRYAIGGRVFYNRGQTDSSKPLSFQFEGGRSYSFSNAKGNKYLFSVCEGYTPIGGIEVNKGTVIFSTNGYNSEIGIITINDNIHSNLNTYQTLFNDINDPNGDLLNFREEKYIKGIYVEENEFIHTIYFVDDFNQERRINLKDFYNSKGEPYHPIQNGCGALVEYPKHISVHAFDVVMDLVFPYFQFKKRIEGSLKSGKYQIIFRYKSKNAHVSTWSYIPNAIFVTDQKMDGEEGGVANAYKINHHNRVMGASNVMTQEGFEFTLENIDTRWDEIEVAYIYYTTDILFQESNIFKTVEIGTNPNLTIQFQKHNGISVTYSDINVKTATILSANAIGIQDNRKWIGGLVEPEEMIMDTSDIEITPTFKLFNPDETLEPTFQAVDNPVSKKKDGDPLTNTFPKTSAHQFSRHKYDVRNIGFTDDYENYKGQLFESMFKGYFRQETYPFSILFLDRKGIPGFSIPISDYTFPSMYEDEQNTLSQKVGNFYHLRIMGAMFNNIKIPVEILYDKFGKLNISGFMIVRSERIERIKAQGILVQAIKVPNKGTETENDFIIEPRFSWLNIFTQEYSDSNIASASHFYHSGESSDYSSMQEITGQGVNRLVATSAPYYFTYHSPDLLIEGGSISDQMKAGRFRFVGVAHKAGNNETITLAADRAAHLYTKNYRTLPLVWQRYLDLLPYGRVKLGDTSRISLAINHTRSMLEKYIKFDPDDPYVDFYPAVWSYNPMTPFQPGDGLGIIGSRLRPIGHAQKAALQPGSQILKLKDFESIDLVEGPWSRVTEAICNWEVTPDNYYTEQSDEEQTGVNDSDSRRYFSTGHYQQITQSVLDGVDKLYDESGKITHYVFNNVEVWGGDCFVNLFDFSRMQPEHTDCAKNEGFYRDYSSSHIIPIESKYNIALTFGRRFAKNAILPQSTSCSSNPIQFSNGIMPTQPEDWTYNRALMAGNDTVMYFPKPKDIRIVSRRDTGIRWTPIKTYGELQDSYRKYLPLDYADIEGYGKIQGFVNAFNSLYVIQEFAFGMMNTNMRTFIPTNDGQELVVRSAESFGGVRYIRKNYGTQHKNSIWSEGDSFGFVDARSGKVITFSQAGATLESQQDSFDDTIMGATQFFDIPVLHESSTGMFVDIISGVDRENNEVYTTFHHLPRKRPITSPLDRTEDLRTFTISYSRVSGTFQSFHHFKPYIYINSKRYLLSAQNNNMFVYNHGKYGNWFGEYYPTILRFIVNPQMNVSKFFDNGYINVNYDGYNRISQIKHRVNNLEHLLIFVRNENGEIIRDVTFNKVKYEKDSLTYTMKEKSFSYTPKPKLNGQWMEVELTIDNSQQEVDGVDQLVTITSFDTVFRPSLRHQYTR